MNFNKINYFEGFLQLEKSGPIICFKREHFPKEELLGKEIFGGLPEEGTFIWKKGNDCNQLLQQLPISWNKMPTKI